MASREEIEGLIAASLYEPLSEAEQQVLDEALAADPSYREEMEAMQAFLEVLPTDSPEYAGDLRPVLEEAIREAPVRRSFWNPMRIASMAAVMLFVLMGYQFVTQESSEKEQSVSQEAGKGDEEDMPSPMEIALDEAAELEQKHDHSAVLVLAKAIEENPDDPKADRAQLQIAQMEYEHGQRFVEAQEAYATLKSTYPEFWAYQPQAHKRLGLLESTAQDDYIPIIELNKAVAIDGDEQIAQLESVISQYPGTLVASAAVDAMRSAVGGLNSAGGTFLAAGLEALREQCTNPIALAHVNYHLGEVYWKEMQDDERARDAYCLVPQTIPELAQAAQLALDELGACPVKPQGRLELPGFAEKSMVVLASVLR